MPMSIYMIVLDEPDKFTLDSVRKKWPRNHFVVDDRVAFIAPDEPVLTKEIQERIEMGGERRIGGIVAKIGASSGYWDPSLWEWMEQFE